eukprot:jgi/Botrbrau1/3448/Bobra.139_1s0028.1
MDNRTGLTDVFTVVIFCEWNGMHVQIGNTGVLTSINFSRPYISNILGPSVTRSFSS